MQSIKKIEVQERLEAFEHELDRRVDYNLSLNGIQEDITRLRELLVQEEKEQELFPESKRRFT